MKIHFSVIRIEKYVQTHCGTSPLHFPFSSQVDKGSPTTLYPLSHLYFARAPILYEVAPVFEFSAVPVRINVLPYIRSFPVTERIPCSASTGSGQRISEKQETRNMKYEYTSARTRKYRGLNSITIFSIFSIISDSTCS